MRCVEAGPALFFLSGYLPLTRLPVPLNSVIRTLNRVIRTLIPIAVPSLRFLFGLLSGFSLPSRRRGEAERAMHDDPPVLA
jgi:hypothetical protein